MIPRFDENGLFPYVQFQVTESSRTEMFGLEPKIGS